MISQLLRLTNYNLKAKNNGIQSKTTPDLRIIMRIGIETNLDKRDLETIRDRVLDRISEKHEDVSIRTVKNLYPRQYRVLLRLRDQWEAN